MWAQIWHQAITRSLNDGKPFGRDKTVVFSVKVPIPSDRLRLRFSNLLGAAPYEIGAVSVWLDGTPHFVTLGGKRSFSVPTGGKVYSDELGLCVSANSELQIRIFYRSVIADCNMIEEQATLLDGDRTEGAIPDGVNKPLLGKILGAYNAIPSLDAIELQTDEPPKTIVAFGDSITAMSRWTKPLAERLQKAYNGEYLLLNSGISGNCLLYEVDGILGRLFGGVYGEMGTKRFGRDVLDVPNLSAVILGLGVNDVSYYSEKTKGTINLEAYKREITRLTDELHARGVRVTMETITPRLGVSLTMGKFTQEMEGQRLLFNDWIRSVGIFDYVFDAEAVVREERTDGFYYAEGLHQGDHLHPNTAGGQKLADAFDLKKLTGKDA